MDCFAGIAGAAGVGAKATFSYNRDNFLYDRKRRMRKEFKIQDYKVAQASLWREDVRDLISLTEYKMHAYLLVNVLLLGFAIVLYCEGRLPPGRGVTPDWVMMGMNISITGAFMFLLLSIWMAMHAAVAAQGFEARLLTQMVRLPIPSWQEIEACRTYGSEFEQTEARQMFRVPFVMGRQEGLVHGSTTGTSASRQARASSSDEATAWPLNSEEQAEADAEAEEFMMSESAESMQEGGAAAAGAADPWGLERRGDEIYELGCRQGAAVAGLRHVKLARQAMIHWQSYDAFARVSMSIGVNQLLLAISYYLLGYVMVEVGQSMAATYGIVLMMGLTETLLRLDMSLLRWQMRTLQLLQVLGPFMSCVAGYHWSFQRVESLHMAEALIVLAFLTHGLFIAMMSRFCRIEGQRNGSMLPLAFRSVLYLDAFGGARPTREAADGSPQTTRAGSPQSMAQASTEYHQAYSGPEGFVDSGRYYDVSSMRDPTANVGEDPTSEASLDVAEGVPQIRPSLGVMDYDAEGRTIGRRPEDMAPPGHVQDLRNAPGAPDVSRMRYPGEVHDTVFYDATSWLSYNRRADADRQIVTGHEREAPRILPWQIFTMSMLSLCLVWISAGIYHALGSAGLFDLDPPVRWELHDGTNGTAEHPSLLGFGASAGPAREWRRVRLLPRERLQVRWPHADAMPRSLACDATGQRFVAADGLALFAAELSSEGLAAAASPAHLRPKHSGPRAVAFAEVPCPGLEGEGLQDVAVACSACGSKASPACEALLLHRHGRRVAACRLGAEAGSDDLYAANVSGSWLERLRTAPGVAEQARGPHARLEKAVAISADSECGGGCPADRSGADASWRTCSPLLGTTQGRLVKTRERRRYDGNEGAELVPADEVLSRGEPASRGESLGPGAVHSLGGGYLGVLQRGGNSLLVLDGRRGGAYVGRLGLEALSPAAGVAEAVTAFCAGGGALFLLGAGPSPQIWRVPLPSELVAA